MPTYKPGDHVRVLTRTVTEEDRKKNRYFEHMAGLTGTVQQVYSEEEVAVEVDLDSLSKVSGGIHQTATQRMRDKFMSSVSEEQRRQFTKEELNFDAHYVVLVRPDDLEKA